MTNKYIFITTFPNQDWYNYLHICTLSLVNNLPEGAPLLIKLPRDGMQSVVNESISNMLKNVSLEKERKVHVETGQTQDEVDFYNRHANYVNKGDYRTNYIDFSHKVFALYQAYLYAELNNAEYVVWIDADILLKEKVTEEDLDSYVKGADIAYLGRKDWNHSECGFVAYKTSATKEFIDAFHALYTTDDALSHKEYHDSYLFDRVREQYPGLNYHNISEGIEGRDVFNKTILGEKMIHYKGQQEKEKLRQGLNNSRLKEGAINVNDMVIKTKNCMDIESIREHIKQNMRYIKNWYKPCKKTDETIVICSAGPSLNVVKIRELYKQGYKIVAVKHAIKPLMKAGVIPWAVILLDPRPHVANFLDDIDPSTYVFVASMVDPIVIDRLYERNLKVIGYHAAVGANEQDFLNNGDSLIIGGSATATRGISLLEGLGFRNMELYGYDCCYYEKPNLQEKKDNDTLKYEEITLETNTYGEKKVKRTWWTEGQFLAQLQEFKNYYYDRECLNLNIHGDGLIAWLWNNRNLHKQYLLDVEKEREQKALTLDNYLERLYLD